MYETTDWRSFKWRNYDPSFARFFNVDPLSEDYAYQSHYNFSENRVIDGVELEGLEWTKSSVSNQDGTKAHTFNATIKLLDNSTKFTSEDVKNFQTSLTKQMEDSFNGTMSNGDQIVIGEINYIAVNEVKEGDYSITFNDVLVDSNGSPGVTSDGTSVKGINQAGRIGNTQENNMQVVPSGKNTAEFAAHEVGHSFGLRHQTDLKNPQEVKVKMEPTNLMYSPQFPGSGADVVSEQRDIIMKNVPDEN